MSAPCVFCGCTHRPSWGEVDHLIELARWSAREELILEHRLNGEVLRTNRFMSVYEALQPEHYDGR